MGPLAGGFTGSIASLARVHRVAASATVAGVAAAAVGVGVWTLQPEAADQKTALDATTEPSSESADLLADRSESAEDESSRSARRPALVSVQRATKADAMPATRQDVAGAVSETVEATDPRDIAMGMLADYGWSTDEFSCLDSLYIRESGWNPQAENTSSGAYGIPQALPGDKMATYGSDWQTNPTTQLEWGLAYIQDRYGSPCGAWNFFLGNNFY